MIGTDAEKFFFEKDKPLAHHSSRWSHVTRFTKDFYVEVNENVEWKQKIVIDIDKFKTKCYVTPKANKYTEVRPIVKELFYQYYYLALKYICEINCEEGEFYYTSEYKEKHEINWFSLDEKNRLGLKVKVYDSIETCTIEIDSSKGWQERPNKRKNGKPIKPELFKALLKLSINFLYDPENLETIYIHFVSQFKNSLTTDNVPVLAPESLRSSINNYTKTLAQRIDSIQQRLIVSDSDTAEERIRLRGELEGLRFALNVIQS